MTASDRKDTGLGRWIVPLIWAGVFLVEAVVALLQLLSEPSLKFEFQDIWRLWLSTVPFLVLFLVHNYLIAPLLTEKNRPLSYSLSVLLALGLFAAYIMLFEGVERGGMHPPEPKEQLGQMPPPPPDEHIRDNNLQHTGEIPGSKPMRPGYLKIVVALLMLGVNLGAKYYLRFLRDERKAEVLEKENLRYRLEYLRYQINPHFFMNTLNNIHALVDIDPDKAKDSIVELSRLMRYMLYDNNTPTVPLAREEEFLTHYLALMRLRYRDDVDIVFDFPDNGADAEVPPLTMATIVENAFKHGISAESGGFIRISAAIEKGRLIFRCANSRPPGREDRREEAGIGLDNIRKRLELLYGDNYVLHIEVRDEVYELLLVLPARAEKTEDSDDKGDCRG